MASAVETLIRIGVGKGVHALAAFNRKRLPQPTAPHPYLSGLHAPMREELTLSDLPVTGAIPEALDGRYLRIGPNPIAADPASYHWFTGDGMVHGVRIKGGRALWYRNRWIRSRAVAEALHEAPAPGVRNGSFDTVNTNVVNVAGRTFALVEAGSSPVSLSEELDGQVYDPFDGGLKGAFTAHPHRDPLTGEQHAICYEATRPDEIRHVVIDSAGAVVREELIAVEHGPSIHDCAVTGRYVVILDLPVTFSMGAMIGGHSFPYRWNPAHRARVGLMPRAGTQIDIVWCDVAPGYVFHTANAYDLPDGRVVIDVCAFDTMFDGAPKGPNARSRGLERWTADPASRTVEVRTIDPSPQEFPRPDERRIGQPYRFAYALALPDDDGEQFLGASQLYKHDLETGARQVHDFGPQSRPGEFVFTPRAPDSAEDDGWLMGLVIDAAEDATDLVILDARDFEAPPVARVHLAHRIPPGFHGNWVPARA